MSIERTGRMLAAIALIAAGGTLSCGGDSTGSAAGSLVVSLTSPNSDDGALLLTISGGEIKNPTATASSHRLFFRAIDASSVQAVIVGNISPGPVLSFETSNAGQPGSYGATILEVAARDNALRGSLAGYSLAVQRP